VGCVTILAKQGKISKLKPLIEQWWKNTLFCAEANVCTKGNKLNQGIQDPKEGLCSIVLLHPLRRLAATAQCFPSSGIENIDN